MKKGIILTASAIIMTFFMAAPALASNIDRRLHRQATRIEQGIRSGELTRHEENRLWNEHHRIRHSYDRSLRNGWLSHRERHRLNQMLNEADRHIHALKHNHKTRRDRRRYSSNRHYQNTPPIPLPPVWIPGKGWVH
jgi:septal ring factor EnvC (AmiA/AmiB activator)